jgi:hypothetical protein
MSFFANCSPLVCLWVIIITLYLIFLVLSNKKIIKNKSLRHLAKKIIKHRFKLHIIHDVFWITFIYAVFFSLYQLKVVNFNSAKDIINFFFALTVFIIYTGFTVYILKLGNKYKNATY